MTTTDTATQTISATVTGNQLDLSEVKYVTHIKIPNPRERWNASSTSFPDKDSQDNACRITAVCPITSKPLPGYGNDPGHENFYFYPTGVVTAVYPTGQQVTVPTQGRYAEHKGKKLSHFAMAALAAWKPGDARSFYNYHGEDNTSNKFSHVMWERAVIEGYITYSAGTTSSQVTSATMVRTDKPVEAKANKPRRMSKNAVWPFTEKDHWLKIMNGSLQICNTNTRTAMKDSSNRINGRDADLIAKSFPVFESASEFKRARKFFEGMSAIKNPDSAVRTGQPDWDPLRNTYSNMSSGIQRHTTRQSFTSLLSSPFSIIKTTMMLCCIPIVEEDGTVSKFKEITADYLDGLKSVTPVLKAVTGTWRSSRGYLAGGYPNNTDMDKVKDFLSVDNMTHMYMILLNELRLLDNESFDRWCKGNNLIYGPFDFETVLASKESRTVYGYKLTQTLNYSCIVWGKDHKDI